VFAVAHNFRKVRSTPGCTPAPATRLTNHKWTIKELVRNLSETHKQFDDTTWRRLSTVLTTLQSPGLNYAIVQHTRFAGEKSFLYGKNLHHWSAGCPDFKPGNGGTWSGGHRHGGLVFRGLRQRQIISRPGGGADIRGECQPDNGGDAAGAAVYSSASRGCGQSGRRGRFEAVESCLYRLDRSKPAATEKF